MMRQLLWGLAFLVELSVAWVLLYRFVPPPVTWLQLQRNFEDTAYQPALERSWGDQRDWINFDQVPRHVWLAILTAEDQKFAYHWGFDLEAIQEAQRHNENLRARGKPIRGASTLSQQTAKNVFLWPGRSWLRKGLEVYFTGLIELLWPKARILEVYLNVVEMGPRCFGVEAYAQHYYGKPASQLTRTEGALLAACLPNPRSWHPGVPIPGSVRWKQQWILRNLWQVQLRRPADPK
jgi:monofunctional biosynthetic peptidoglycan transglycosylase